LFSKKQWVDTHRSPNQRNFKDGTAG